MGTGRGGEPNEVQIAPEKLQALADAYTRRVTTQPGAPRQTFAGRFAGRLPGELGGAGEYRIIHTLMGSAAGYVERFAGLDDLTSQLAEINQAADTVADILGGWLASRLETRPGFEKLCRFMDTDFRKDLKNLAIYLWSANSGLVTSEANVEEIRARAVLYVIEHGYLEFDDAFPIARLFGDGGISEQNKGKAAMFYARKLVAGTMGIDPNDHHLAFLSDPNDAAQSLQAYIRTTEAYRHRLAQWKEEVASRPADDEGGQNASTQPDDKPSAPEPGSALEEAFETLGRNWSFFGWGFGSGADRVGVALKLPAEPLISNGHWDEKSRGLTWSFNYRESPLSHICYGVWAASDAEFQKAHFGRVVLEGQDLASFCGWRKSLTQAEASQWDEFLQAVGPATAEQQLRRFVETHQLPDEPVTQPSATMPGEQSPATEPTTQPSGGESWLGYGAGIILGALDCSASTQPAAAQPTTASK